MKSTFIEPRPELKAFIQSFWLYESPIGMSLFDTSLSAPDGRPKLVSPVENSITTNTNGEIQQGDDRDLYFRDSTSISRFYNTRFKKFSRISRQQDSPVQCEGMNRDRLLNKAIVECDIADDFEQYLEIFEAFYADEVEVCDERSGGPIRGKSAVRSALLGLVVPVHVMAEVGGLAVIVEASAIPGDRADETHSSWILHMTAPSGSACSLTWSTHRKWKGTQVFYERHYDYHQSGGSLTLEDLTLWSERVSGWIS